MHVTSFGDLFLLLLPLKNHLHFFVFFYYCVLRLMQNFVYLYKSKAKKIQIWGH